MNASPGSKEKIRLNRAGVIVDITTAAAELFGSTPELMKGRNLMSFVPAAMHEHFYDGWSRILDGKRHTLLLNGLHTGGMIVPMELRKERKQSGSAKTNDDGTNGQAVHGEAANGGDSGEGAVALNLLVKDMSHYGAIEEELRALRESYMLLAETTTDVILQIDHELRIIFANSAAGRVFGYDPVELERRSLAMLFPESQYRRYRERIRKYFVVDETHRRDTGMLNVIEVLAQKKNGELIPVEISMGNSRGVGDSRILTCIIRDITLRKKADRRLRFLAYRDRLTSLGNRDRFSESLNRVLQEVSDTPDRHAALLYLDLDGFKKVNDSMGHEIGDTILKACAQRLMNSLREGDQVYRFNFEEIFRLGGDEFTILLPFVHKPEDAAIVARRVIDRITEPFAVEDIESIGEVQLGVSIGIAVIPRDGRDSTTILRNADAAMYRAKERGNSYVFFTDEINDMAVKRVKLEQDIRKALARSELELYYQPVVDERGTIICIEALLRWNHPERGVLSPATFLTVVDEIGYTRTLGAWVFSKACADLKRFRAQGHESLRMAVNISPIQLEEPGLDETIHRGLERAGLENSAIILELTEDALMEQPELAESRLRAIKSLNPGISIAIDDFGTGYSSLAYLTKFPVDHLKIDQSFVSRLHVEENERVVKTIIDLGMILKLEIIAEGVETAEQLAALRTSGCGLFQGYFFQHPRPVPELLADMKKAIPFAPK